MKFRTKSFVIPISGKARHLVGDRPLFETEHCLSPMGICSETINKMSVKMFILVFVMWSVLSLLRKPDSLQGLRNCWSILTEKSKGY